MVYYVVRFAGAPPRGVPQMVAVPGSWLTRQRDRVWFPREDYLTTIRRVEKAVAPSPHWEDHLVGWSHSYDTWEEAQSDVLKYLRKYFPVSQLPEETQHYLAYLEHRLKQTPSYTNVRQAPALASNTQMEFCVVKFTGLPPSDVPKVVAVPRSWLVTPSGQDDQVVFPREEDYLTTVRKARKAEPPSHRWKKHSVISLFNLVTWDEAQSIVKDYLQQYIQQLLHIAEITDIQRQAATNSNTDARPPDTTSNTDARPPETTSNTDARPLATTSNTDARPPETTSNTDARPLATTSNTDARPLAMTSNTNARPPETTSNTHARPLATTSNTDARPLATTSNTEDSVRQEQAADTRTPTANAKCQTKDATNNNSDNNPSRGKHRAEETGKNKEEIPKKRQKTKTLPTKGKRNPLLHVIGKENSKLKEINQTLRHKYKVWKEGLKEIVPRSGIYMNDDEYLKLRLKITEKACTSLKEILPTFLKEVLSDNALYNGNYDVLNEHVIETLITGVHLFYIENNREPVKDDYVKRTIKKEIQNCMTFRVYKNNENVFKNPQECVDFCKKLKIVKV